MKLTFVTLFELFETVLRFDVKALKMIDSEQRAKYISPHTIEPGQLWKMIYDVEIYYHILTVDERIVTIVRWCSQRMTVEWRYRYDVDQMRGTLISGNT